MLKKQDVGNGNVEEEINQNDSEENEVSEDENEDNDSAYGSQEQSNNQLEELYRLLEEEDTLRCQVEALKNELIEMQATHEEDMERKNKIYAELLTIKEAIDEANKALSIWSGKRSKEEETDSTNLPASKKTKKSDNDSSNDSKEFIQGAAASTSSSNFSLEKEARLISLISIFLHVLPFGANIDYICSYLHQLDSDFKTQDVENVLKKYPSIFKQNSNDIGGSLSENWRFVSFQK